MPINFRGHANLLAPDGRLISPRWRVGIWLTIGGAVLRGVGISRVSTQLVDATGRVAEPQDLTTRLLLIAGSILVATGVVIGAAALLWRLRSSEGLQREQLSWICFAAGLLAFTAVFVILDHRRRQHTTRCGVDHNAARSWLAAWRVSVGE